jgi:hypothetical protein
MAPSGGRRNSICPCRPEEEMLRHCAATARVTRSAAAGVQSNVGDITCFLALAHKQVTGHPRWPKLTGRQGEVTG